MSTRDELAMAMLKARSVITESNRGEWEVADALIAEGWRKKPSRDEIARALWIGDEASWNSPFDAAGRENAFRMAEKVLALMDRA